MSFSFSSSRTRNLKLPRSHGSIDKFVTSYCSNISPTQKKIISNRKRHRTEHQCPSQTAKRRLSFEKSEELFVIEKPSQDGSSQDFSLKEKPTSENSNGNSSCCTSTVSTEDDLRVYTSVNKDGSSYAHSNRAVVVENLAKLWLEQQIYQFESSFTDKDANKTSKKQVSLFDRFRSVKEKLSSSDEPLDVLELDGMELLDHDQELGESLLSSPDSFATDLMDEILRLLNRYESHVSHNEQVNKPRRCAPKSGDICMDSISTSSTSSDGSCCTFNEFVDGHDRPARGSRLWIRFTAVPLPLLSVEELVRSSSHLLSRHPSSFQRQLIHVHGVVYAISTVSRIVFRKRYFCKVCKNAYDVNYGTELLLPAESCCRTWILEDIESHDYIPYQEILLGPVPKGINEVPAKPFSAPGVISISLFDDLTGKLQLGDSVAVVGHGSMVVSPPTSMASLVQLPPSGYVFSQMKIVANNIFTQARLNYLKVLPIPSEKVHRQAFFTKDGRVSLDLLCNAISHGPGSQIWPKLLPISILLSLVANGCSANTNFIPQNLSASQLGKTSFVQKNVASRQLIHILLVGRNFCSTNALQSLRTASMYASRSVYFGANDITLGAKIKQDDATKDREMLFAGALALGKGGVLIVDVSLLSKSKLKTLTEALIGPRSSTKNSVNLRSRSDQECALIGSSSTTVWACHELIKPSCAYKRGQSKLIDASLLRGFDIVLDGSNLDDCSEIQCYYQNLIMHLQKGTTERRLGASFNLSLELQHHLFAASKISSITMSKGAYDLIQSYYLSLRKNKEFSETLDVQADDVSLYTLQSLLWTAEACARLCLRTEIIEVPDATLAIMLCENSHMSKYGYSLLQQHEQVGISLEEEHLLKFHDKLIKYLLGPL